jgi:hypothetical protein
MFGLKKFVQTIKSFFGLNTMERMMYGFTMKYLYPSLALGSENLIKSRKANMFTEVAITNFNAFF